MLSTVLCAHTVPRAQPLAAGSVQGQTPDCRCPRSSPSLRIRVCRSAGEGSIRTLTPSIRVSQPPTPGPSSAPNLLRLLHEGHQPGAPCVGTEVAGLWTAEEASAEWPASSQVLPGPCAPEPPDPQTHSSPWPDTRSRPSQNEPPLEKHPDASQASFKITFYFFVNFFFFLKVRFTFSSRVLCLLVSALVFTVLSTTTDGPYCWRSVSTPGEGGHQRGGGPRREA